MRAVELAALAAQAEGVRVRHQLRRLVLQLALALFAGPFLLGAVILAHATVYVLLEARLPPAGAFGCIAGFDLLVAVILLALVAGSRPSRVEREARELSRTAAAQILPSLSWARLAVLLIGRLFRREPD